jgi:hypothetical protein
LVHRPEDAGLPTLRGMFSVMSGVYVTLAP